MGTDHSETRATVSITVGPIDDHHRGEFGGKTTPLRSNLLHRFKSGSPLDLRNAQRMEAVCAEPYN